MKFRANLRLAEKRVFIQTYK